MIESLLHLVEKVRLRIFLSPDCWRELEWITPRPFSPLTKGRDKREG
jgi:hypothetical protein